MPATRSFAVLCGLTIAAALPAVAASLGAPESEQVPLALEAPVAVEDSREPAPAFVGNDVLRDAPPGEGLAEDQWKMPPGAAAGPPQASRR